MRQDIDSSFMCQECGKRAKAPNYCLTCKKCDEHCDCEPVYSQRQCPHCDAAVVNSEVCRDCGSCPRCCSVHCAQQLKVANGRFNCS